MSPLEQLLRQAGREVLAAIDRPLAEGESPADRNRLVTRMMAERGEAVYAAVTAGLGPRGAATYAAMVGASFEPEYDKEVFRPARVWRRLGFVLPAEVGDDQPAALRWTTTMASAADERPIRAVFLVISSGGVLRWYEAKTS